MQRKITSEVLETPTPSIMHPKRVDRKVGAQLVTQHYFRVSPRTLECWPLPWRLINGRAQVETSKLFDEAQRRVDAAPCIMGGK